MFVCQPRNSGAIVAAVAALGVGGAATADVFDFIITLDGSQEVPPVTTPATGTGTATLDTDTNLFSWNVSFSGLNGSQTAAHFHAPAPVCVSAGVSIGLPLGSPIVGSATVTEAQEQQILQGLWYLNVHSDLHPAGEIRGQVELAPLEDPIPAPILEGEVRIRLETVATGFAAPTWGTSAPGHPDRFFIVDQTGQVANLNLNNLNRTTFLDVSDRLVELGIGGPGTFDERGLLGLAFHPDYQSNGLVYTYTSEPFANTPADFSTMPAGADPDHQTVILEWQVANPSDPNATVDPNSARELLRIDQPQFNHNAGTIAFGPDDFLYIALGDGGAGDDQDTGVDPFGNPVLGHGCNGNGQDLTTILGTVIRIDPQGNNSANGEYGVPADNPFVGKAGLDEIWAYGLRNPFRFSFDRLNGELWLGDAGQNHIEEIDVIERGGNYGWNIKEGSFRFVRNGASRGYATTAQFLDRPDLIDPVAEYDHDEGVVVVGGFVYRGLGIPELQGRYVFGEFAPVFNETGRILYLDDQGDIQEAAVDNSLGVIRFIHGFGEDANGEIYVMATETGTPFGETGVVMRLAREVNLTLSGDCPGEVGVLVTGATPGGRVAILAAFGRGNFTIPGGVRCAGTPLGLDETVRVVRLITADQSGAAMTTGQVSAAQCDRVFVQAVDVATCRPSDVEAID
ncbi:MAG: PQQ-dependent sugar dehydrogenase [Phycisphaerales bacterium]